MASREQDSRKPARRLSFRLTSCFFAGSLPISLSTWTWLSTRKARVPRAIDSRAAFSTRLFTTPVSVMFPFSTTMRMGGFTNVA